MSGAFQKRFNTFRHRIGVTDPEGVFHSFRHTWRDALRQARVAEEVAQQLGGWKGAGEDKRYGMGLSVRAKFEDMKRIEYPDLDLTHLYST
ncbi:hypothetical protein JH26_11295 [Microvirga sp. BSC39]|nr:hypothetical protein JH26_11295 [Microvirga sp. BSC39]